MDALVKRVNLSSAERLELQELGSDRLKSTFPAELVALIVASDKSYRVFELKRLRRQILVHAYALILDSAKLQTLLIAYGGMIVGRQKVLSHKHCLLLTE